MIDNFRPLGVGDLVRVLRASRLPIEESLGVGEIHRTERTESGERIYWVRGFTCARTERVLRRTQTLAEWLADREEPGQ